MTRLLPALLAVALLAPLGFTREIDPARFSGTDQEKVEKAFAAWAQEPGSTLRLDKRQWTLTRTVSVSPPPLQDRVSGTVVGARYWLAVQFNGPPGHPAFEFHSAKDVSVTGLCVRGGGVRFRTATSSARITLADCRMEGTGTGYGYEFAAEGNGDISVLALRDCEAQGFASGFRWSGPNNLDPYVDHCIASECGIGFDLREGGSNALLRGIGGTRTLELVAVNGGYQIDALVQSAEHCGTVFRTGGDDAAGFGQTVPQVFRALSIRDCTGPWAVVNKSGDVTLDVSSMKGPDRLRYENRSSASALRLLTSNAANKSLTVGTGTVEVVPR